jgi:iron(III) transport system ATP-binding protein
MLRVEGLTRTFVTGDGQVQAVHDVSFEVKTGEFFSLLGPSGCGKTTTLRCIAGLETPDSGEIWIDDRPVFSSKKGIMVPVHEREIGMVFQSYAVWPHMNVAQNVGYPLVHGRRKLPRNETKKRVKEILHLVQLDDLEARPSSLLSGGQQQRVAVARALVAQPQLLLMDEPLSNLDAKLRVEMRHELRDLFERLKLTALYVTHDQEEALVLSHRMAVMHGGRVVQLGPPMDTTNLLEGRIVDSETSAERSLVETAVGKLRCALPQGVVQGQRVSLMFRPEAVSIHTAACGSPVNVLPGRVRAVVFTGNRIEYDIDVGQYHVRADTNPYVAPLEKGQSVWLEMPADRIRVLAA